MLALSGPASLGSWSSRPSPPPRRASPQLQRIGHCSRLLAELWKPPRLNAAPADVTAACDQSAPRGPSVNHSASLGRGECGETAFRGSVAAAPAAPRGAGDGRRGAWPPPTPVSRRFRWEGLKGSWNRRSRRPDFCRSAVPDPAGLRLGCNRSGKPGRPWCTVWLCNSLSVGMFCSCCFGLKVCPGHRASPWRGRGRLAADSPSTRPSF